MKVLHLFPSSHRGGSELCASETIKALNTDGFENYAIFPTDGDIIKHVSHFLKGYAIIENSWWLSIPKWSWLFKLKMLRGYFLSAFYIKKFITHNNIDVVITHTLAIPSGAIAAKWSGKKHIWYIHEYGDKDHGFKFCYGRENTLKIINRLSQAVVVNSHALFAHFEKYFPASKLSIINYVVAYPLSKPIIEKEKNTLKVCMVGRLAQGKNQQIIIEALFLLKEESVFPELVLVGSANDEYLHKLHRLIREYELQDQVTIVGASAEPWKYVQQAHAVVVCSVMEAFGRVTIEAMKSGKIAIVANTGAGKELVKEHETGYLFNPDDVTDLVKVLKHVWQLSGKQPVAEAAYLFAVTNFNEEMHRQQFLEILNHRI